MGILTVDNTKKIWEEAIKKADTNAFNVHIRTLNVDKISYKSCMGDHCETTTPYNLSMRDKKNLFSSLFIIKISGE